MRQSWFAVVVLIVGFVAVAFAQNRGDTTDGSLAALTAELRQLRLAVVELGRIQTQTQAVSAHLTAQQGRIQQAAARFDTARDELQAASMRSREVAYRLESIDRRVEESQNADQLAMLKETRKEILTQQAAMLAREEQARATVAELSSALATEEARWADLVSRLEQLLKK